MTQPENAAQADIARLVSEINANPDNWQAYADLVAVLVATENLVEAEELALKSLGLFQANDEALQNLLYAAGNVYYVAGDYARANEFFAKITDLEILHDATVMQAQAWYAQNQFQKALVFALTAVEQQPENVAAQVLLGNIWLGLQNMDKATTAFNDAIHVDPMNFDANFGRGIIAIVDGDRENQWSATAEMIDMERYRAQAQRLDEIVQLLSGSRVDESESN